MTIFEEWLRLSPICTKTISDYVAFLSENLCHNIPSRAILVEDAKIYCDLCDDVIYDANKQSVTISSKPRRDAVRYFLGEIKASDDAVLKPQLSSSVSRSLFLALKNRLHVSFEYIDSGGNLTSRNGFVSDLCPGLDSGYAQIFEGSIEGELVNPFYVNIARILPESMLVSSQIKTTRPSPRQPLLGISVTGSSGRIKNLAKHYGGDIEKNGNKIMARFVGNRTATIMDSDCLRAWLEKNTQGRSIRSSFSLLTPEEHIYINDFVRE